MLKNHVRVEEIRQQYRLALTLVAPVKVAERDKSGMGRRFANRLQVRRDTKPFKDSVQKRCEADAMWLQQQKQDPLFQDPSEQSPFVPGPLIH